MNADVELTIGPLVEGSYRATLRFRKTSSSAVSQLATNCPVQLDFARLREAELDNDKYGRLLTDMLFAALEMQLAWAKVRGHIEAIAAPLRLRICLSSAVPELQQCRWETMCDPELRTPLASNRQFYMSRFLDSQDMTGFSPLPWADVRVIAAVVDPVDAARFQLSPIPVAAIEAMLRAALAPLPTLWIGRTLARKAANLEQLMTSTYEINPHILIIISHGAIFDERSYLCLEDEAGKCTWVDGIELINAIIALGAHRRPQLVVLMSCQTAGSGSAADQRAYFALGPQLARSGVPAVLAMQSYMPQTTGTYFLTAVMRELRREGQIDRAVALARAELAGEGAWWMPVLFTRLVDGQIWTPPATPVVRIFITYARGVEPDELLALRLQAALQMYGYHTFIDGQSPTGTSWAISIEREISSCDYLIPLLSAEAMRNEMLIEELRFAAQIAERTGKAHLLPIRMSATAPVPYQLRSLLEHHPYALWREPGDNEQVVAQLLGAITENHPLPSPPLSTSAEPPQVREPRPAADPTFLQSLDEPGGAVQLDSELYIHREYDTHLIQVLSKARGTTTTIRAPRQTGKTSVLIRGVQAAERSGRRIVYLDVQELGSVNLQSLNVFLKSLATTAVTQLGLDAAEVEHYWDNSLGPSQKATSLFEQYLIPQAGSRIVLALDEIDLLLGTGFQSDFFGLVRSWHNRRAVRPVWNQLDLLLAISTEPHLLITDVTQSPFNVGLRLYLRDFTPAEVRKLHTRYLEPLAETELDELTSYLGGHPYLTQRALYTIVSDGMSWGELRAISASPEGPFGDHLRRYQWLLRDHPELRAALHQIIRARTCPDETIFYRLRQAGLANGADSSACSCRCQLYADYFWDKLS